MKGVDLVQIVERLQPVGTDARLLDKFAQCAVKSGRHLNQDSGSRQIESQSQRDSSSYNLTNVSNTDSTQGTNSAPRAGAMYGNGSMFGARKDVSGGLGDGTNAQKGQSLVGPLARAW